MRTAVIALLTALLAGLLTAPAAAAPPPTVHHGELNGAEYLVKVPHRWNGTLVLFSHGYYPEAYPPPPGYVALSTAEATEGWLLDHGYALAASNYTGVTGFATEAALRDQLALLDWFTAEVGRPRTTISSGMSMGGLIAVMLAERHPHRFDGVLSACGEYDGLGTWNVALDINFAVRTLLTDDDGIELVKPTDPHAATEALRAGIASALTTEAGRAKLALVAALGNVPGWMSAHNPAPTALADKIRAQAQWVDQAYVQGVGPYGRVDLERRAGGNPTWNVGVDYRRQLALSGQLDLVRAAYRTAGADLGADLAELNAGPRIAADPRAVAYLHRYAVARGTTPAPVVTLHNPADGGAVADQVRWYAEHTDDRKVRHLWVGRGNHCAFSAAEEVTALRALEHRIDTGRWADTSPGRLNATAKKFAPEHHVVKDIVTWEDKRMPPAFDRYTPAPFQRPSR